MTILTTKIYLRPVVDDGLDLGPSLERVAAALRARECLADRSFDRFLPYELWRVSRQFWTPLVVALRVAEWLDAFAIKTAVDIGAGAGKLCVASSLASRCDFTGLEQRPRLVEAARSLAQLFGVEDRVRFIQATVSQDRIPEAEAYYLYNPFGENLFGPHEHLDDEVELSHERYRRDVASVETFLHEAPVGTYVIKYNGFGGRMPASYEEVRVDRTMPNLLRMWRKARGRRTRSSAGTRGVRAGPHENQSCAVASARGSGPRSPARAPTTLFTEHLSRVWYHMRHDHSRTARGR